MNFLECRGYAHGNVHDCTKSADDYACDQKSSEPYRSACLPELQERFHISDAQSVDSCCRLGNESEDHRQGSAGECSQESADSLAVHASKYGEAHKRYVAAHEECGQNGWSSPDKHWDKYQEEAQNGEYQANQGFKPGPASNDDSYDAE